jgi:hypothetical protein
VKMTYNPNRNNTNLIVLDEVYVTAFNEVPAADFRVYYHEQRADFPIPQSSGSLIACPVAGLTNAQAWAQHGVAIAGAVAPAGAGVLPDIDGLVV